jgi:hypothetical protein
MGRLDLVPSPSEPPVPDRDHWDRWRGFVDPADINCRHCNSETRPETRRLLDLSEEACEVAPADCPHIGMRVRSGGSGLG